MAVKPIPDGYHSVTPYLIVPDGAAAIAFYQQAFEAKVRMRLPRPDGKIANTIVRNTSPATLELVEAAAAQTTVPMQNK